MEDISLLASIIKLGVVAWVVAIMCAVNSNAQASSAHYRGGRNSSTGWISAPVVGLLTNSEETEIRGILGVPGASTLSAPIALPEGVMRIHLAPTQRWALAELEAGGLSLLHFEGTEPGLIQSVDGGFAASGLVSFSPTGHSAAMFSRETTTLQILTKLDSTPHVRSEPGPRFRLGTSNRRERRWNNAGDAYGRREPLFSRRCDRAPIDFPSEPGRWRCVSTKSGRPFGSRWQQRHDRANR
jgi:hypothetical protein